MKIAVFFILSLIAAHGAASPTSTDDFINSTGKPSIGYMWNPYCTTNSKTLTTLLTQTASPLSIPSSLLLLEPSPESPWETSSNTSELFALHSAPASTSETPTCNAKPSSEINILIETLVSTPNTGTVESLNSHLDQIISLIQQVDTSNLPKDDKLSAFKGLQNFLNDECNRLSSRNQDHDYAKLHSSYVLLASFCNTLSQFRFFSPYEIRKLNCFEVRILIGAANTAGLNRKNLIKLECLTRALHIINNSLRGFVHKPYGTNQTFRQNRIRLFLENQIKETRGFIANKNRLKPQR